MADTDWGGLIGTVIIGGIAYKMASNLFGDINKPINHKKKKGEKTNEKMNKINSLNYPRFNNPFNM